MAQQFARELPYLPIVWGVIIVITLIYVLIVRSSEVYRTSKQLWITTLLSLGISLVLSAALLFLLRVDYILVIMITTLATFIVGHFGSREYDQADLLPDHEEDSDTLREDVLEPSKTDFPI